MKDDKIIKRFEKDYKAMDDFWSPLHKKHRTQTKFVWFNDQWDTAALSDRKGSNNSGKPLPPRPTLVFNLVKAFVIKVTNGIKKMKPSLKVAPIDGDSDKALADVRRGIIKSIEMNSGAIPARLNAMVDAVTAGYGFYRFVTDYIDPMSMNQEFVYKNIEDATAVLFDESSKELDGSDNKKTIIQEKYSKREFKLEFNMDWDEIHSDGNSDGSQMSSAWGTADSPTVSEYWFIEQKKERLVTLTPEFGNKPEYYSNVVKSAEGLGIVPEYMMQKTEDGKILERPTLSRQVWQVKLAGKKVLEKIEWPGYWIPIFKIDGRVKKSQGDVIMSGLADDATGSQKAYNYARNNQLERLALTPKVPYLTPVGSIPKTEKYKWDTANTRNWTNLNYNAMDENGNPLPMPQRANSVQVDPGLALEVQTSAAEIKSTMGLYGSFLGDTSGEKSGRAILAGAEESADTVYDFANNMAITMGHEGRVVNELIPKVYPTAMQIRMVGEDEKEKVVWINQQAKDENGKDYYHDMKQGKFDVKIEMGPGDSTRRAENRDQMEGMLSKLPPEFTAATADILALEQDSAKSEELAARFKKLIKMQFQGLIEEDEGEEENEIEQMQQQLQENQQQMEEMNMALEKADGDKQAAEAMKEQNRQMELQIKAGELDLKYKAHDDDVAIKQQELEDKIEIAQINVSKDVKINDDKLDVEMLKVKTQHSREREAQLEDVKIAQQGVNINTFNAVTTRMSAEQSSKDAKASQESVKQAALPKETKKEKPQAPPVTNIEIKGSKVKRSTIKPNKDGSFDVITKDED